MADDNTQRPYDTIVTQIVDYAYDFDVTRPEAYQRATATLLDAMGAAFEGLTTSADCRELIGPAWPAPDQLADGFRLPGTKYQLDVLKGAFDMGLLVRYLDHNDAFPGAEWGHPSDNLGAILATADILSRQALTKGDPSQGPTMKHVLIALIKAYEIQGCFQIKNAFNRVGLDHVILVKVASTAVTSWLLGLTKSQAKAAVSHAWLDGHPLRVYRQAPNAGPRKGWAGGDACMRAVHLALLVQKGQPGVRSVLTAPRWGFYDVLFRGKEFDLPRPFGSWVVENVLFKVSTAEGHGLTAVEAALTVSQDLQRRGRTPDEIARVRVRTQEAAMIIINKVGPLHNAADRDHCLKYMVAVVLLKGAQIETEDYQDASPWATDPRVDELRGKITLEEDPQMTRDYHNPEIRSLANALRVTLADGTELDEVVVDFPVGHVRREETLEAVREKTKRNLGLKLSGERVDKILGLAGGDEFDKLPVREFVDLLVPE
ncbi:putative 2-methylcitrate dehydratase [Aspergillus sclerotiicarbonarius CBS 121057]|uniref:Putative 2-methylcitrate dehydratase n=1 Tax=Aspergillus sclerotiicarbonarius (strain CBS 121057 / IBT 28362) TaxID=1448318 RepID=A0A319DS98_ASPSB|nr:putative 2-methylcitrate dehydratase [Aspergillus sclerotiicarbonarius CBS 121057]